MSEIKIKYHKSMDIRYATIVRQIMIDIRSTGYYITHNLTNKDFKDEVMERIDEFDVIKDNCDVDFISLNNLYDFYETPFNEKTFTKQYNERMIILYRASQILKNSK